MIIGFTISKNEISHSDIDVFRAGIGLQHRIYAGLHFYTWGFDKMSSSSSEEIVGNSATHSLFERKLIVRLIEGRFSIENDWLGSIPVFYSESELVVSTLLPKVAEAAGTTASHSGIAVFLRFGYSAFGSTIYRGIRALRFYSKIEVSFQNRTKYFHIQEKQDPALAIEPNSIDFDEVSEYLDAEFMDCVPSAGSTIILPLSGGFDSRILGRKLTNFDTRTFTYHLTKDPAQCSETIFAGLSARKFGFSHEVVTLSDYFDLYEQWVQLYGASTHLHGMYQIQFYDYISSAMKSEFGIGKEQCIVSGILGDVWAGTVPARSIYSSEELDLLSFSHGVCIKSSQVKVDGSEVLSGYYESNFETLSKPHLFPISTARAKLVLLSYLLTTPEYFGFKTKSPFLDYEVVSKMIALSQSLRKSRKWQVRYLRSRGLYFEDHHSKVRRNNDAEDFAFKKAKSLKPLEIDVLDDYVRADVLLENNKRIFNPSVLNWMLRSLQEWVLPEIFFRKVFNVKKVHIEYLVLKALDLGLQVLSREPRTNTKSLDKKQKKLN